MDLGLVAQLFFYIETVLKTNDINKLLNVALFDISMPWRNFRIRNYFISYFEEKPQKVRKLNEGGHNSIEMSQKIHSIVYSESA